MYKQCKVCFLVSTEMAGPQWQNVTLYVSHCTDTGIVTPADVESLIAPRCFHRHETRSLMIEKNRRNVILVI